MYEENVRYQIETKANTKSGFRKARGVGLFLLADAAREYGDKHYMFGGARMYRVTKLHLA